MLAFNKYHSFVHVSAIWAGLQSRWPFSALLWLYPGWDGNIQDGFTHILPRTGMGLARPLSLFAYVYVFSNKIFLSFIASHLPGLPSLHQGSWTSFPGDCLPLEQKPKWPHFLRPHLKLGNCHFCHILLVKMSPKSSPDSRGGEIVSISWWKEWCAHTGAGQIAQSSAPDVAG